MIEWKRIDKDNPPVGRHLFIYDHTIYDGWTINKLDDDGYPYWESSDYGPMQCYDVRWYAEINMPDPIEPK